MAKIRGVTAGVVKQILLGDSHIRRKWLGESVRIQCGQYPLHPDVHRDYFGSVKTVQQYAVGNFGTYAANAGQNPAGAVRIHMADAL